ncbi:MAG: ankyrin repeat domain-containing protein [Cystobacter sp.]
MSKELFAAIEQHDVSRVQELLTNGADPNEPQAQWPGLLPMQVAINELAEGGGLDVLITLLEHGADVNAWNSGRDVTSLLVAVFEGQQAAVEALLKAGADANVRGSEGDTPLRACVGMGDLGIASLLLDAGATRTSNEWGGQAGYTALGIAASRLDLPMRRLLLDAGAQPEAPDEDDRPARDRLPSRDTSDTWVWDTALELLRGAQGRSP